MNKLRTRPKSLERPATMDVVRERKRGISKGAYIALGIAALIGLVAWALISLTHQAAGTVVDKSTLVTDVAAARNAPASS